MHRTTTLVLIVLAALGVVFPAVASDSLKLTARLVTPISSRVNRQGDKVSAIVVDGPEAFRGAPLDGVIEEAKSSGDVKKTSSLRFAFKTLTYAGRTEPITADIVAFTNSKGQQGVDEEGRVVKKSSGVGKSIAAAAIGAGIGALLAGGKGAAIGAGVGLVAGFVFVSVAVKGPEIRFDTDARLEVAVRSCPNCAEPAFQGRTFNNGLFAFQYPADWQPSWDANKPLVTVAPAFGIVPLQNGRSAIGYGVVAGLFTPNVADAGNVVTATEALIRVFQSTDPRLEVLPGSKAPAPNDAQVFVVAMASDSGLEPGRDLHLLVTMSRPNGLFFFTGVGPASRFREVRDFSMRILGTLRFQQ